MNYTHGSLFSGIGGFDLSAERCGIENIFQVEIDDFCQKVLAKNFPNTEKYKDIKEFDGTKYYGAIDILTGGFPCQPFSVAGKQAGTDDPRHLFPQMLRVISEIMPTWVIAENVRGLLNIQNGMVFEQVCSELENLGYEVQTFIIPALAINAPHRRDRLWIIANSRRRNGEGKPDKREYQNEIDKGDAYKYKRPYSPPGIMRDITNSNGIGKRTGFEQVQKTNGKILERDYNAEFSNTNINTSDSNSGRLERTEAIRRNSVNAIGDNSTFTDSLHQGLQGSFKADRSEGPESNDKQPIRCSREWNENWYEVAAELCKLDDGVRRGLHNDNYG